MISSSRSPTVPSGSVWGIRFTVTPSTGSGWSSPNSMSSFTHRSARLEGIANPSPSMVSYRLIILMVLIPTTWPYSLISGPPEFPEFSAAVVWSSVICTPSTSMSRSMAEMMPSVRVFRSSTPRGFPMAYTWSPTRRSSDTPNTAAGRSSASTFSTARSTSSS